MVAVLYNLRSIHNTASCFRTADGVGLEKLYLVGTTPRPIDRWGEWRRDFAKVALGAEKSVAWEGADDIIDLVCDLRKKGLRVVSVEQAPQAVDLFKWKKKTDKLALVFGEETKGLPEAVLRAGNEVVEIPMRGEKESLNVSVAFGVATYVINSKKLSK